MVLGKGGVDTRLSSREIVIKLHGSAEYLNSILKQHSSTKSPIERRRLQLELLKRKSDLSLLGKKLGNAFLKQVMNTVKVNDSEQTLKTARYNVSQLSNQRPELVGRYIESRKSNMDQVKKHAFDIINQFVREQKADIENSKALIRLSRSAKANINKSIKDTKSSLDDLHAAQKKLQAKRTSQSLKQNERHRIMTARQQQYAAVNDNKRQREKALKNALRQEKRTGTYG
jgi:hypothetical protein|tara:strand:- start:191 stop:877 length:687 start_codon:yes stop_codon:yes gene_type:complete